MARIGTNGANEEKKETADKTDEEGSGTAEGDESAEGVKKSGENMYEKDEKDEDI
jgi:hypothetical protein